ncbi:MAG TPA: hypothetical protein VMM80_07555, partial [Bacteroidota bacterium]|nr:hypothetical protein [Bacteroidota bacterium]
MTFTSIGDFARYLESARELHRVKEEVDAHLEIAAIAARAIREERPAILFERVRGSRYPVLVNALASDRRCELALQAHPEQLGEDLVRFLADALPPRLGAFTAHRSTAMRFLHAPVRMVRSAPSQQVSVPADIGELPVLTC